MTGTATLTENMVYGEEVTVPTVMSVRNVTVTVATMTRKTDRTALLNPFTLLAVTRLKEWL